MLGSLMMLASGVVASWPSSARSSATFCVAGQHVRELRQDPRRQRDVAGLDRDPGGAGERRDDRQQRRGGEERRFIGQRVEDLRGVGHGGGWLLLDAEGAGSIGAPPHRAAAIEAAKSVAGGSLATRNRPVIVAVHAAAGKSAHTRRARPLPRMARHRRTPPHDRSHSRDPQCRVGPRARAGRCCRARGVCRIGTRRRHRRAGRLRPARCAGRSAALRARPSLLVAGGGDGTVAAVASQLVDGDTRIGRAAAGHAQPFRASDLGIPLELEDAVRVLVAGRRRVDVGDCAVEPCRPCS